MEGCKEIEVAQEISLDGDPEKLLKKTQRFRLETLLLWLIFWPWTTENVIRCMFSLERRPCAYLVRRGVLRKIMCPFNLGTHNCVYVLGDAYVGDALKLYAAYGSVDKHSPYRKNPTAAQLAKHGKQTEVAQLEAITAIIGSPTPALGFSDLMQTRPLTTKWELHGHNSIAACADFIIHRHHQTEVPYDIWYLVELRQKTLTETHQQFCALETARQQNHFKEIVWICQSYGHLQHIRSILQADRIPYTYKRADGRRLNDLDATGWDPTNLLEVSRFQEIS